MQTNLGPNSRSTVLKDKGAILIAALLVFLIIIPIAMIGTSIENRNPPTLVIRVDDIQDFAFREAQLFLLNNSIQNHVPLSLAVIAGMFGGDSEIVQTVKLAVNSGSKVAVHGWEHEDLAKLSFREQMTLLFQAKNRIRETLDVITRTLVPPMFSFNEATLDAMHEEGYDIISTSKDLHEPGLISGVRNLPATVELSDYSNGLWNVKSCESVKTEILRSVQKYGFAVIVTHPQEFITNGKLNQTTVLFYTTLLENLNGEYSFKTLERLGQDLNV
ncbi:polysaccharide deacetylase family protein [Candidatus Bathyarchaeota archaeon]|nr:polysaccharide deacetylase family protein [Candidatus Bathyarchaeota archaeon]